MSSPAPAGDSPQSPTLEQRVYDKHRGSVVHLVAERATKEGWKVGSGTGFIVHNDGTSCLVLTCAHLIKESKRLSVRFGADRIASARLVHVSEPVDLALLRVQGASVCTPLEFSDEADLSGKEVVVMGFIGLDKSSICIDPGTSRGHILGEAVVTRTGSGDLLEFFTTNLSAAKGMSGSPVFLEDNVAGVLFGNDAALINVLTVASVKAAMKTWARRKQVPEMTIRDMLQVIAEKLSRPN
ncbi:uncharacterized protein [Miscanthus floridulus]|uniref:uncharacterized protein n=1 Tax=Miscanthus floridulus TaxID=154761 RepID=UPI003459F799